MIAPTLVSCFESAAASSISGVAIVLTTYRIETQPSTGAGFSFCGQVLENIKHLLIVAGFSHNINDIERSQSCRC